MKICVSSNSDIENKVSNRATFLRMNEIKIQEKRNRTVILNNRLRQKRYPKKRKLTSKAGKV